MLQAQRELSACAPVTVVAAGHGAVDDAEPAQQQRAAQAGGVLAGKCFNACLGGERIGDAQAVGASGEYAVVVVAAQPVAFPFGAQFVGKFVQARLEQAIRDVETIANHLLAAEQVAHHQRHFPLAGHGRQVGNAERPRGHFGLHAAHAVDVQVQGGGQVGFASQGWQRKGDEPGLGGKIGGQLHSAKANRPAPGAADADGVADSQAGATLRHVPGPGGVQAYDAVVAIAGGTIAPDKG